MKNRMKRALAALLLLCLTVVLPGCGGPEGENGVVGGTTVVPPTTELPAPQAVSTRLEAEGRELGQLFVRAEHSYVKAESLGELEGSEFSEEGEILRLRLADTAWILRNGSEEAETADGGKLVLDDPVLRCPEGWYLPLSVCKTFFGLTPVSDDEAKVLRLLRVEEGPELLFNGAALETRCRFCDGNPVLSAARLAEISGGSLREDQSPEGTPTLTLQAWEHELLFREGAVRAELDGEDAALPVPAWREGEDWYLPLTAAEALGCCLVRETDSLALWKAEEGPLCWFAGKALGSARRIGDTLCAELSVLADALGGTLSEKEGGLVLEALDHSLRFRPGERLVETDGTSLMLPIPILPEGTGWLVPISSIAEAFGMTVLDDEGGVVYSRIEPCETVIWINGAQAQSYTLPEGGLYLRLDDAAAAGDGSFTTEGNEAGLAVWGKELRFRSGADLLQTEGETLALSKPVLSDGTVWYAPADELLPALGLTELIDPELDQRWYTHVVKNDAIPTGYRVPVLMYHAVSDYTWGIPELFVSPAKLEAQLKAMLDAGYTPITFEDLDRIDEIEKPVMLTFDDGYDDNYTELFPLLQKYNVKVTIFMIVNDIGKNHKLTRDQIREMSDSGLVSIQSHTMSHGYLDGMYENQLRFEHYESMLALARITGKQPFVMCYPTGKNSAFSRSITAEYYQFGLNMGGPCYVTGDAPYRIYRYYISRYTDVDTFLAYLAG